MRLIESDGGVGNGCCFERALIKIPRLIQAAVVFHFPATPSIPLGSFKTEDQGARMQDAAI